MIVGNTNYLNRHSVNHRDGNAQAMHGYQAPVSIVMVVVCTATGLTGIFTSRKDNSSIDN